MEPTQAGELSITRDSGTGLITASSLRNITHSTSYNGFGESTDTSFNHASQNLLSFSYQRDQLGRITQRTTTDQTGHSKVQTYTYDALGRLASESKDTTSLTYSYDVNGNRLNDASVYDPQDRLVENASFLFFYDKSGFLIEKRRKSDQQSIYYTYDSFGRLLKVDDRITNKVVEYIVDAEGRRIARKLNGGYTHGWIYKDALKPIGELKPNIVGGWNLKRVFLYGTNPYSPDAVINLVEGTTHRIITDHLGSPRMVVDANSGEVVQELDYDTWGNVVTDSSPGMTPFGFAGGLYDPDTGLVRFGARDYDPSIGRWLDRDPIGFEGGANWYVYVGDNPVNSIDPSGLKTSFLESLLTFGEGIVSTDNSCGIVGSIVGGSIVSSIAKAPGAGYIGGIIGGQAGEFLGDLFGVCGPGPVIPPDPVFPPPFPPPLTDVCSPNIPNGPIPDRGYDGPQMGPTPKR